MPRPSAQLNLAGSVDLLTTTERMDEMWPMLRRLSGLALPKQHVSERPKFFTPPTANLLADDAVVKATERLAPFDWQLHRMAVERTQAVLSEWSVLAESI